MQSSSQSFGALRLIFNIALAVIGWAAVMSIIVAITLASYIF